MQDSSKLTITLYPPSIEPFQHLTPGAMWISKREASEGNVGRKTKCMA